MRPHGCGWQSKSKEPSECSIHDEGLPELPIKSLKLLSVTSADDSKASLYEQVKPRNGTKSTNRKPGFFLCAFAPLQGKIELEYASATKIQLILNLKKTMKNLNLPWLVAPSTLSGRASSVCPARSMHAAQARRF